MSTHGRRKRKNRGSEPTKLDEVVIPLRRRLRRRMQLTGNQFSTTSALMGNDLSTLPDFPAEIRARRAPCRRLAFQCGSPTMTSTPGRRPGRAGGDDPAALKKELEDLSPTG